MTVKVVCIGFGGVARPQLEYFDTHPDVEVVAGADISDEAQEWFERTYGVPAYASHKELLDNHGEAADAASIITPHTFHRRQILDCLAVGLDVYVEKPMVVGLEAAVEVVETARETGCLVQVGFQRHFHPLFQRMRAIVAEGRIGQPHFAACYLEQDWIEPHIGTWRTNPSISGGGQLYDSGSHLLDVLLWTTDASPGQVAAVTTDAPDQPGVDVDSALAVTLDRDGAPLVASVGVTADGPSYPGTDERLVVVGTDGKITYADDALVITEQEDARENQTTERVDIETNDREVFVAKLDDFVAAVRGEKSPAVPGEMALDVTALTEAAYEAADTGQTVDIQEAIATARATLNED